MPDALNLPALIKEIGRGARGARDLTREQACLLFSAMLAGEVDELCLGAIVLALRVKGESSDELLGFADALAKHTLPLAAPSGPRTVLLPALNGARKLLNLMPLLALHLSRLGVPVLVHGRSDFGAARGNTFALLETLGHAPCDNLARAQTQLEQERLAVLPTALLSPGLDALMALRPRLGLRNSAHTLAKLLDPFQGRSVRVVAVTHGDFQERLAEALPRLTEKEGSAALLLKGCEGEAYPHARRAPSLQAWQAGQAVSLTLGEAEEAELWETEGDSATDAQRLRALLEAGPAHWPARLRELAQTLYILSTHI